MFAYAKPEQKQKSKKIVQKKEPEKPVAMSNLTGIPDTMKTRFESLSGFSFDDVRVHYNSDKPAQLQALAYTQGNQVHIAPGQEKHLGHELGHVVQQKAGRVRPTIHMQGVYVNDNTGLEREADWFGNQASVGNTLRQFKYSGTMKDEKRVFSGVIQREESDWVDGNYRYIQQAALAFSNLFSNQKIKKEIGKRKHIPKLKGFIEKAATCVPGADNTELVKEARTIVDTIKNIPDTNLDFKSSDSASSHRRTFHNNYIRTSALTPENNKVYLGSLHALDQKRPRTGQYPLAGKPNSSENERINATVWDLDINRAYIGGGIDKNLTFKVLQSDTLEAHVTDILDKINEGTPGDFQDYVKDNKIPMFYDDTKPHKYTALTAEIIQLMQKGYVFRFIRHTLYAFKDATSLGRYLEDKNARGKLVGGIEDYL